MDVEDDGRWPSPTDDEVDLGDRRCPVCGALMLPHPLPSGEIANRCPNCGQIAI